MPHGFEYVVRPYQTPGSHNNTVIPATPRGSRERAHLTWGGKGTMPSAKVLNPSTKVDICTEFVSENDRDSDRVRIIGNDGESYVDVDRARVLRLKKNSETADQSLTTWQGFTKPKLDPKVADDPNFKPPQDPGTNAFPTFKGTCLLKWEFKNP